MSIFAIFFAKNVHRATNHKHVWWKSHEKMKQNIHTNSGNLLIRYKCIPTHLLLEALEFGLGQLIDFHLIVRWRRAFGGHPSFASRCFSLFCAYHSTAYVSRQPNNTMSGSHLRTFFRSLYPNFLFAVGTVPWQRCLFLPVCSINLNGNHGKWSWRHLNQRARVKIRQNARTARPKTGRRW